MRTAIGLGPDCLALGGYLEDTQFYGNWEDAPDEHEHADLVRDPVIPPKGGNAYLILAHQYVAA